MFKTLSISYQYPGLFLIILLICAYFIALWYLKPLRGKVGRIEYLTIFTVRLLLLSLLIILIFRPQFSWQKNIVEHKKHLLLIDRSLSVSTSDKRYQFRIKELYSGLLKDKKISSKLTVYSFGDSLDSLAETGLEKFDAKFSDLSEALQSKSVEQELQKNKFASLYLVSDGLFNRGENPLNHKFNIPVHTVLAGLADQAVDLRVQDLFFPETVNSAEENKWEVTVGYQNPGTAFSAEVSVNADKKILGKQKLIIPPGTGSLRLNLNPSLPEQQVTEIEVRVESGQQEKNYTNNKCICYQKKADNRDKILIVSGQPSLDYRFLVEFCKKHGISFDRVNPAEGFKNESSASYKTVIILDLPDRLPPDFVSRIQNSENGVLVFINSFTSLPTVAEILKTDLPRQAVLMQGILQNNRNPNSEFLYNSSGEALSLNGYPQVAFVSGISLSPELYWPVLDGQYQNRKFPACWISRSEKAKIAVLNLENFWRLLFEVKNIADNDHVSSFLLNLIEYLAASEGQQRLAVSPAKTVFSSGEPVLFAGKYYDRRFQVQSGQKIRLKLDGRKEEIWLNASGDSYNGVLPVSAPGLYEYTIEVVKSGQIVDQKQGSFKINVNNIELSRLNPDSLLMRNLAEKNGGTVIDFDSLKIKLEQLSEMGLEKKQNISIYPTGTLWYLLGLILLFITEWLWRKIRNL